MDQQQALAQIEEIGKIIESSGMFQLSGKRLILYGVTILIIPIIELSTGSLTFGANFGAAQLYVLCAIHIAFYFLLFRTLRLLAGKLWPDGSEDIHGKPSHPIIAKALSVHQPLVAAIIGTIVTLVPIGYGILTYPFVFVFFGILFNLYGRFAIGKTMVRVSWSLIVLGFVYVVLTAEQISNLWIYFNSYLALSFVVMGVSQIKGKARI